ncbi:hypothetical protein C8R31_101276 [Nitrosospira sp. Nsp2]|nr:hypothetical protein C8R31_101276 [Nitrosospira sp. Nsp2]
MIPGGADNCYPRGIEGKFLFERAGASLGGLDLNRKLIKRFSRLYQTLLPALTGYLTFQPARPAGNPLCVEPWLSSLVDCSLKHQHKARILIPAVKLIFLFNKVNRSIPATRIKSKSPSTAAAWILHPTAPWVISSWQQSLRLYTCYTRGCSMRSSKRQYAAIKSG